jgi:prevent-host-death family protein
MTKREPQTETMKISDVKATLSSLVNTVYRGETRVLIEKSGIPVAALVSADDLARLERLDREWDEHTQAMERFSAAFSGVPVAEIEAEIDRIVADIRRQDRAEAERQTA